MKLTDKQERGLIVERYMRDYPKMYKLSLAKKIFSENTGVFTNVEHIRSLIRARSNQNGEKNRSSKFREIYIDEMFGLIEPFHEEIKPDIHIPNGKALIISDIHGFKQVENLKEYFMVAFDKKIDTILLNGDCMDFEGISKFPITRRAYEVQKEIELTREMLYDINDVFPSCRKFYKIGNHEIWLKREIWRSSPSVSTIDTIEDAMTISTVLELNKNGFEIVENRQMLELGLLLTLHGNEANKYGKYIANAMFEYFKRDILFGHFHRKDEFKFKVFGKRTIQSNSLPCACDLNATYTGINNQWSNGFAIVEWDETDYDIQVYQDINGKIRLS